jgi:RES domain-containing protein
VRLFRLCRRAHAAFDGEGARLYGGRWNPPGVAVVYTSATPSLAVLESLVHLDPEDAPDDLVLIAAELPAALAVTTIAAETLPRNWRDPVAPQTLRSLGLKWVQAGKTVALAVPSAVLPSESNVLLNPAHPDFRKISVGRPERFTFDRRLARHSG